MLQRETRSSWSGEAHSSKSAAGTLYLATSPESQRQEEMEERRAESEMRTGSTEASSKSGLMSSEISEII